MNYKKKENYIMTQVAGQNTKKILVIKSSELKKEALK